ncbi:MAG: hypothetical protein AM324_005785 [Candidatus Thorarchaeota archaeon SMTZ1-83]|nr:MAG: hypothetical protein AM324_06930 [Candidatus Thorarchaeota archaeon SMTZ1-83]
MADLKKIGQLLVLLGGIVGLLFGILIALNMGFVLLPGVGLVGFIGSLVTGVILVLLSLIVLATSGAVNIPALKFDNNWIVLLILGILMYVFGGDLGAILVIIGAILYVVK